MKDCVRVGVIGTSWYADLAHLPRLKSHPRCKLAAVCGRNRERADEMAAKYDVNAVYTNYRAMIEAGDLDAVVVSTPDDQHYPMTMAALDAGLHVLCEKPMALTLAQAQEMYERAEAAGVKHMVCFTYRWWPPTYRYLKQLIEEGYLGRLYQARFTYLAGYARQPYYQWKWDRLRGLGSLGDQGSHMIDLARWYGGEIARVSANLQTFVERPGPEGELLEPANDACLITVQYETGAQATIEVGAVAHVAGRSQDQHIRLYGSDGSLECDTDFPMAAAELRGARSEDEQWQVLHAPDELWAGVDRTQPSFAQFGQAFNAQPIANRLFIDAILEDRSVTPSFYDGLKAQEVIDAALRSHQSGEWISLGS
jgi:predicted dehydrogenase